MELSRIMLDWKSLENLAFICIPGSFYSKDFLTPRQKGGGVEWILWIMTTQKIKIGIPLREGRKNAEIMNNEQKVTDAAALKARNGMGSNEELLQIIEGESKEGTREEGITITVIAVGGSLKNNRDIIGCHGNMFLCRPFTYLYNRRSSKPCRKDCLKNIEKAIQRTTAEFAEGKFGPEALKGLGKNIDIEKLKGQAMRNLGGWEGDRGEGQSPDKYKGQEDYLKHIPRDDLEKRKDYYKDKYKEMLRR